MANHRIGDAGTQAILEFVGKNDRKQQKSAKPKFDTEEQVAEETSADEVTEEKVTEEVSATAEAEAGDLGDAAEEESDSKE